MTTESEPVPDSDSDSDSVPVRGYAYMRHLVLKTKQRNEAKKLAPLTPDLEQLKVAFGEGMWEGIPKVLGTNGVVIVTGVFSDEECERHVEAIVDSVCQLSDGVSASDLSTWTPDRLLPQLTPGIFQCGIGHTKAAWRVRGDSRVREVFAAAYGREAGPLVGSLEMVKVWPPIPPFNAPCTPDWAHFDDPGNYDKCLQGQVVLANTQACLVCSPRSHMVYNRLANLRKGSGLNAEPNRSEAQAAVEAVGGLFQVPCVAPRGSMILFLSTTLHSARFMPDPDQVTHDAHDDDPYADDDDDDPDVHSAAIGDSWRGWRCVVFVAFRPKAGVSEAHIHDLLVAFQQNRITRHGGSLFPKKPWDCYAKASTSACTPRVREIFESIVERCEMPVATLRQELDDVVESTLGL